MVFVGPFSVDVHSGAGCVFFANLHCFPLVIGLVLDVLYNFQGQQNKVGGLRGLKGELSETK